MSEPVIIEVRQEDADFAEGYTSSRGCLLSTAVSRHFGEKRASCSPQQVWVQEDREHRVRYTYSREDEEKIQRCYGRVNPHVPWLFSDKSGRAEDLKIHFRPFTVTLYPA